MKKKPPVITIILTLISLLPPLLTVVMNMAGIHYAAEGFLFYALAPAVNLIAVAVSIVCIILCQRSVKLNGQYLSAYIILIVNCALIIINLALILFNHFTRFPRNWG